MGTRTLFHTFTGSEPGYPGVFMSGVMPNFSGTFTITNTRAGSITNSMNVDVILGDAGGTTCWRQSITWPAGQAGPYTQSFTVGTPAGNWHCTDFTTWSVGYDNLQFSVAAVGSTMNIQLTSAAISDGPACVYGAQPNPAATISTAVSLELLLAVMSAMALGPEAILFWGFMMGWPLIVPICNAVPDLPPAITDADFLFGSFIPNPLSVNKFVEAFNYGLWKYYCECKPAPTGNPPPVGPPSQTFPPRITNITVINSICSNADICTYLTYITNLIYSLNLQLTVNNYGTTNPPYVLGMSHPGLTGDGELAVSGILGAFVSFTTLPNRAGVTIGDPSTVWDVGHITFGTADGWEQTFPISHNPWLIQPQNMSNVVKIGYSIPLDCVLTLTELVPNQLALPQGP